jgi:hypothetical protein
MHVRSVMDPAVAALLVRAEASPPFIGRLLPAQRAGGSAPASSGAGLSVTVAQQAPANCFLIPIAGRARSPAAGRARPGDPRRTDAAAGRSSPFPATRVAVRMVRHRRVGALPACVALQCGYAVGGYPVGGEEYEMGSSRGTA